MTTLREFCRATGAALHVAGVERYAAPLVRAGYLPRSRDEVSEQDAAFLLLAMAAAPCPGDAVEAVERLSRLPLLVFKRLLCDENSFPVEEWLHVDFPDEAETVCEIVENEIKFAAAGVAVDTFVQSVEISEGGGEAKIWAGARQGNEFYLICVVFADPATDLTVGLRRFVKIDSRAFRAMGAILAGRSDTPEIHDFPMHSMEIN